MRNEQSELDKALSVIAGALNELGRGLDQPPKVSFDVEWIDTSTMGGGKEWRALIKVSATTSRVVSTNGL